MTQTNEIIYFDIHNIKVKVSTNIYPLGEYIVYNLSNFKIESQIENCDVIVDVCEKNASNNLIQNDNKSKYVKIAKNLYLGNHFFVWTPEPWFEYKLSLENNIIYVTATIDKGAKSIKSLIKSIHDTIYGIDALVERYMYCMRLVVYFPVFWLLGKNRNIGVMHGSAVVKNNKAIVLTGYNGVGKSTLAAYLSIQNDFDYITDNFVLYDHKNVYAFPELFRFEPKTNSLNLNSLETTGKSFDAHGRRQVLLKQIRKYNNVPCDTICFNLFGSEDTVKPIDMCYIRDKIMAMDAYLPEFIDYNQFLSMIALIYPDTLKWNKHDFLEKFLFDKTLLLATKNNIKNISMIAEALNDTI